MKRISTTVSLLILGLGFFGNLGLGDAGIVPTAQAAACSLTTLRGVYGYTATGSRPAVGNSAAVGVLTFDGAGNVTGADTLTVNTGVFARRTITGNYTVNANCTGSMSLVVDSTPAEHDIVIVGSGKKILTILDDATGLVATLVADKM